MAIQIDPEQNERSALSRIGVKFDAARVLEVGAGDGRLTKAFVSGSKSIVAIEPERDFASDFRSQQWPGHVEFHPVGIEKFDPGGRRFDVIVFSWSLC